MLDVLLVVALHFGSNRSIVRFQACLYIRYNIFDFVCETMVIMTFLILIVKSPYSLCVSHHQNKRVQKLRNGQNTLRINVYSATSAPFLKAYVKQMED